ncbi:phospholipase DDHD2 [Chrysoperla carnea]|uniref:phospholipase DDHD2 n=1 Tax=Chrysoperla carnea TaxID=189513 RepID=UPI001D087F60|nr:phospholipase DDHD2 [Chrysoperla carnea]
MLSNQSNLLTSDITASTEDINNREFIPITYHWFYKTDTDGKITWDAFSKKDSHNIELAYLKKDGSSTHIIQTNGGRYDVNIKERTRTSVYWKEAVSEVRRCSWFYKGNIDGRFIPYTEDIGDQLETEYKKAYQANEWHHTVNLLNGEVVIFHGPDILVHFIKQINVDPSQQANQAITANINLINDIEIDTGNVNNADVSYTRPRVVKRGAFDDIFDIDEVGEDDNIDHLIFMVHGVGSRCDLKFRSLVQVVNDFRQILSQLIKSHYKTSYENGSVSRIEILPISWHDKLHSDEETGIDQKMKNISLESIPLLRDFTNDTILDALCYTSPIYSQTIISCVGDEMNRLHKLFMSRNRGFNGGVSLAGHSLGTLIIFDILSNQTNGESNNNTKVQLPELNYPRLNFEPLAFFALGSPISMFITIRGIDTLGVDFKFPTCQKFFHIFHPYDPVAYRIESLVNPAASKLQPVLIPHHKGRKRMHLELKETMLRVGTDLKQKFMYSLRNTWNSFFAPTAPVLKSSSSNKLSQYNLEATAIPENENENVIDNSDNDGNNAHHKENIDLGMLNGGRRIDHVLQEAPVEFFNEYLFALQSHVCYWESEDTILLILKEIYDSLGMKADNQIPQQTMTIQPDDDD